MRQLRGNYLYKTGISIWLVFFLVIETLGVAVLSQLIAPTTVNAAVVTIDTTTSSDARTNNNVGSQTVFVSDQIGYVFYRDSTGQCVYSKTNDAGASWNSSQLVDSQTDCVRIAVWYDAWTPDDSGTSIHIVTMDTSEDDLFYNRLDTGSDTLLLGSTPVSMTSNSGQTPTFTSTANIMSLTKATDGEIYAVMNDTSDSYAVSCTVSCDLSTSWNEVGINPFDLRNDYTVLAPLSGGDIIAINRDVSANVIRSKVWNGISWSGSWTNIETAVAESVEYDGGMSISVDLATGYVYLIYATDNDVLTDNNDDIRTAVYDGAAWTTMSDVFTNATGRGLVDVALSIDQNNGHLYAAYTIQDIAGDSDTASIYYRESTDGMTTWGTEVGPINTSAGDFRKPSVNLGNFERLYVSWWDANSNDRFGETLDNIGPDTKVSATGTQVTQLRAATQDNYVGGTFVIESLVTNTLSGVELTETGTVDAAEGLANVELFYDLDTTSPYNCGSESYEGTESQFGSTASSFSAADGSALFSGAGIVLSPTVTFCGYVITDTTNKALDGSTIQIEIADPVSDVTITGTDPFPATSVSLPGTTTLANADVTLSHYHWRNDDGSEIAATSLIGGTEDTPVTALLTESPVRLRLGISTEGSTTSDSSSFQLEYTEIGATCSLSTGWTALDIPGDAFEIFDSANLTDGDDTTNIAIATGGVSDAAITLLTPNAGIKDLSDTASALLLNVDEFVELEFALQATTNAVEGTTYCFRVTDLGTEIANYAILPQVTINADVTVSATGIQLVAVDADSQSVYLGGQFIFQANTGTHSISSVTLSEAGTIDASTGLENVEMYYDLDTTSPYDCNSESYSGVEVQYGSADIDGFSNPNGTSTFSDTLTISPTQTACLYVVSDISDNAVDGDTVKLLIDSPTTDVVAGAASVSPSATVELLGETTVFSSLLSQSGYHWRNDDGSELGATSATAGVENADLLDFAVATPIRLRMSVANTGATSTVDQSFILQFAEKVSSCDLASVWVPVDSLIDDDWDMFDSAFLTHADAVTNIAIASGGVTDAAGTFNGVTGVRESVGSTATTTIATDEFHEYEFSLTSTLATEFGATYCFRLVDGFGNELDVYSAYPEISIASKRDFKVQRGTAIVTGTNITLTAGTDYVAPAAENTAFIRITNTNNTGAGDVVGGGSQNVEAVTAYIQNPENILTDVTIARDLSSNETFVDWEIVEFIGQAGTDNEMLVRDNNTVTMSTVQSSVTGPVVSVDDDSKVVVYVTGVSGNDTNKDYFATQVTAEWDAALGAPVFTRGAAGGSLANISYAVVEYTGMNWQVQRIEHSYTAAGTIETEPITPVSSLAQTFVHSQKRMGASSPVASYGQEVWLSSVGALSFELAAAADMAVDHTAVVWVVENLQTGDGAMRVQRQSGSTVSGAEPLALVLPLSTTLEAVNNASIFGSSAAEGANTAHPRAIAGLQITSDSDYRIWRSDTGSRLHYQVEIVEWPVANLAYRQNYYRFYVDNDSLTPVDAWPEGADDLGENTSITGVDNPPGINDLIRLRMTVQARNANWPANFNQFKLQYSERLTTCTAVASWADVGDIGSAEIWRGFAGTSTIDGTVLSSDPATPGDLLISVADVAGSLEHQNDTATNTYIAFDGEDVEYDWYLEHNGAAAATAYCFRMVEASGDPLSGYLQYPQLITADFTPAVAQWRWYEDQENETPSSALAAEDVSPSNLAASSTVAIRVAVPELKGVTSPGTKFRLQFSEDADFSSVTDVAATSTCVSSSVWCYTDGPVADNTPITTALLSLSDVCVTGAEDGCGTHNSSPDYDPSHEHTAATVQEYSFNLENVFLQPNVVYYFRLFDVARAQPVALAAAGTYPSIQMEGAGLVFTINGLPIGTSTAGQTTDVTTTASTIGFGSLPVGDDIVAAQRLSINTNAAEGYRVWKYSRQNLTNGSGLEIDPVISTNAAPAGWSTACATSAISCVGYHTTDATLTAGSARFAPFDTYASLTTTPEEVMYSSIPVNESHDLLYRIEITEDQPAGTYETDIVYIAAPVY